MSIPPVIAAVVLTYNSSSDLPKCLVGLLAQRNVDLRILVVDNASNESEFAQMRADFLTLLPEGAFFNEPVEELGATRSAFVRNCHNTGYSAGNNIGAQLGISAGCDAVMVINPDVRISNPDYIAQLADSLFGEPQVALVGSAIINLSGKNENPMEEPNFVEEMLWPIRMLISGLGIRNNARGFEMPNISTPAKKLSGSCFLIRANVLEEIGYFDSKVFLYCEESILAAQIQVLGHTMVYVGNLEAQHLHDTTLKGDPVRRFRIWARSRRYYHRVYTNYGLLRRALLLVSQKLTLLLVLIREISLGHRKC